MTNITAVIIVLVSTNWQEIGTFTDKSGNSSKVEEGRIETNSVAIVEFEKKEHRFTLKSKPGPVVGERKIPFITYLTNNSFIIPSQWGIVTNKNAW